MNFRLTAALFGTVFVLGLVLLGLSLWEEDAQPSGELLLTGLAGAKAEQIDTVELERGDGARLVLKRGEKGQWAVAEPITARADAAAVTRVVEALLKVRPTTFAELSANPAVHHLDPPSLRVTLREGDKSAMLNIGDVTIGGSKAVGFVTTPARKRPMAVPRSDLDPLFKDSARTNGEAGDLARWVNDYRTKQVFSVDPRTGADDVAAIKLTAKGKDLALSKAGGWKFDAPAGWGDAALTGEPSATNPTAITGVRPLLNTVVNLQAGAADDFIQDPKDLKEYGLNPDNPDLVRVELRPKDGPPEVAYIGKKADAPAAPPLPGAPAPPGKVYVRVEGAPGVVRVTAGGNVDGLAPLVADPNPLRDRDLLKDDVRGRIDAADLTVGGQTVKFRKAAGSTEWKLSGGPGDPQTADQTAVKALLDLLGQPRVVKDFPAANDANFAGPELKAEVKLWTDGVEPAADPKAEPKPKGAPTVLQFGKKDPTGVYVRRTMPTGAKADFVLPEKVKVGAGGLGGPAEDADVVATVGKSRLDFLDPSVKTFSPFQAAKLTVTQGQAVIVEVAADKSNGVWKFVKPDPQKDRTADTGTIDALLNPLTPLKVGRFVHEQPSRDDLFKFGLLPENPRLKVEVGLAEVPPAAGTPPPDADKRRVYFFGNETDDKQSVYARMEGRDAVFTVPKLVFEQFATADLRDRIVVRFDRAKVQKVELQGWYEITKVSQTTLKFERKNGTWVAEGGFQVDPAKVDLFLGAVEGLRAKAFVSGPPRPEHKFPIAPTPGQPAQAPDQYKGLGVNIELEGGKKLELNIGDLTDGGNSYFLWCGSLPPNEQVVTVQSDPLKPFKEKPAAFAK
ncbi:MAG: hypothetical protein JWO38_5284 [Gemmataceae bacterium]|nr:hypothetical protein [Gemmataceae bacterium]